MTIGIVANTTKAVAKEVIPELISWLDEKNIIAIIDTNLSNFLQLTQKNIQSFKTEELAAKCDIIIAFGGDGTFLSVARAVGKSGVPILGVNLGSLGFLAEVRTEELFIRLNDVINGNYDIIERMVLCARLVSKPDKQFFALNDVVIDKGGSLRLIQIETYVDDTFLHTYVTDGLIVATPTGSTAYSLAAGGPIVIPTMKVIIINPLCPHSLTVRPVVVPHNSVVRAVARAENSQVNLIIDGQIGCALKNGDAVEISAADYQVKWIATKQKNFYEVLRTKLNWGKELRAK